MRASPVPILLLLASCVVDARIFTPGDTDTGGASVDGPCHSGLEVEEHERVSTLLVATWTQHQASLSTTVRYRVGEGDWLEAPASPQEPGSRSQVLLGLPEDTEVEVELLGDVAGTTCETLQSTGTTGLVPGELVRPTRVVNDPTLTSPEGYLLYSVDVQGDNFYDGPYYTVIVDREGRIVWYRPSKRNSATMYAQVGELGGYLMAEESTAYTFDGTSVLHRFTLDLSQEQSMAIPGYAYSFDELPDGTVLRDRIDYDTWEYRIVHHAFYSAEEEVVWGCDDWSPGLSWNCYSNTVRWNEATDTILWSLVSYDTVLEIDRGTGEVVSQWGAWEGSSAVHPEEAMFEFQHFPNYTPDGTLLLSMHAAGDVEEHRAREYEVRSNGDLREIWSYGEGVDEFAYYSGEAQRLDNGNTLIAYGTGGAIREVTPDGRVAWDLDLGYRMLVGHLTLIDDLYVLNTGVPTR